ncbi:hypothetical protein LAZ67_X004616 [Cordylochernes scorpioides]|uniref:Transposase n=1 Tax=Cordylochernes scorpioides TaxID=51811 RepID=A0ABY6LZ80_9ARAC|nr:hypothetical protein LAZ67_X004616 [Cordylochernes scorpioides]
MVAAPQQPKCNSIICGQQPICSILEEENLIETEAERPVLISSYSPLLPEMGPEEDRNSLVDNTPGKSRTLGSILEEHSWYNYTSFCLFVWVCELTKMRDLSNQIGWKDQCHLIHVHLKTTSLHCLRPLCRIIGLNQVIDQIKPKNTYQRAIRRLGYLFGTCQTIIKNDLHLKRSPVKFVPHLLTNEQKEHRKETCKDMVEMFISDPHWLKTVITGDETWVYGYDPETKRQSSQWLEPGEPRFKKARMIKSKLKCLLITFFDVKRLVHYEFVPEGQTINQH